MKLFYKTLLGLSVLGVSNLYAQVGPNLLGAKGTFSAPFVTPSAGASSCTSDGSASYAPKGNIGNPLNTLTGAGPAVPASGYNYTNDKGGLEPEYTYTLIKNIGDSNGRNCIKGDWRGTDHTGDGGWFMAINGAPSSGRIPGTHKNYSKIFYSISSIPVCAGTQYEFSAYVKSLLPDTSQYATDGSEPVISFQIIANGTTKVVVQPTKVPYQDPDDYSWIKVSGTYTAPAGVTSVDLQVINATTVKLGNDFGLDDISFNVVQSNVAVSSSTGGAVCENSDEEVQFTVTDVTHTNTWYKWQVSTDGGQNYRDTTINGVSTGQATFSDDSYTLPLNLNNVTSDMNGNKYRLVVSTSEAGLDNPTCTFVNEYTLIVTACGPTPVTLTQFNARYNNGVAVLDWQTSQEINSDRYEIYRSSDGQQFEYIGSVAAAGYSNIVKNYSFTDYRPGNSQFIYYRLKQIDRDGKYIYSNIVKVNTGGSQAHAEVYPNPFRNYFTVSFNATKTADATLIVRNSIGQPVMKKTIRIIQGSNSINVTGLPALTPGIYYITISNDDLNYNLKMQKQ